MSLSADDVGKGGLVVGRDSLTGESDGVDLDRQDLGELTLGNSISEEDQLRQYSSQPSLSTEAGAREADRVEMKEGEKLTEAGRFLFLVTN